jgi:uncharacterized membrane protein
MSKHITRMEISDAERSEASAPVFRLTSPRRIVAELESAVASSRMGEIDVRARFSQRLLPFPSLQAAVAGERYFPLS